MISRKHRFVFFHIPRTGGTSINKALSPFCEIAPNSSNPNPAHHPHSNVLQIMEELGPDFDDFFKFAIVRNPWDRLVSIYLWGLQIRKMPQGVENTWLSYSGFPEWVGNEFVPQYNAHASKKDRWGWESCTDFLSVDGNLKVDFIGRFENLSQEWSKICSSIGLDVELELEHWWGTNRDHYSTYYNDEIVDVVRSLFSKDIEHFGYKFERA